MCCGVAVQGMMVWVGPEVYTEAVSRSKAREMDFTGRLVKGIVFDDAELSGWVTMGLDFLRTLPAK